MLETGHLRHRHVVERIRAELASGESGSKPVVIEADPMRIGFSQLGGAPPHTPYALVLGCSDARADREDLRPDAQRPVRDPGRGQRAGDRVPGKH